METRKDLSFEPMEVDLSTNSADSSFIEPQDNFTQTSYTTTRRNENEVWNTRTYHIVREKTSLKNNNTTLFFNCMGHLILLIGVMVYLTSDIKCIDNLDSKELKIKLENRLHGQPEVIDSIAESLEMEANSKMLILYGGTGVGKTFTVSIALDNLWNASNVYHFTMPSFLNTFTTDTMIGLNLCKSSIVIVDDLKHNDFNVKKHIAEIITKSNNLNKIITVILIYNCDVITTDFGKKCDDDFHTELIEQYNDIDAYKSVIKFKALTQDILKNCIEDELNGRSVTDMDSILNNFNVSLDGCKGVHKKIKSLNML